MRRSEIHQAFVHRFCRAGSYGPFGRGDLDAAEDRLMAAFPVAYREFVTTFGAVSSRTLLSLIVAEEAELWDVHQFLAASECADTTEMYRSAGMSERLIAFAMDSMGNMFCFDQNDLLDARPDDAPVWLFDHDFCRDSKLAATFDAWLESYLSLP